MLYSIHILFVCSTEISYVPTMATTASRASERCNPLDDHIGYQLRRASNHVMGVLAEHLATVDLTVVETSILILIDRNPGIFQSDIGRMLGMKRANVAPLAAALERRKLLRRTSPEGRLVGLSTTQNGRLLAARAETIMQENDERLFGDLSLEAKDAILEALNLLWVNAAELREEG